MAKIKINVRADEDKDILYYRQFTIVTSLPNAGDEYAGRKVVSVGRVGKDPEQPETRCDDYDCYRLVFSPEPEEDGSEGESDTEYVAISNTEPNHRQTLVRINSVLPSATEANIIIEHYLKRSPSLLEEIDSLGIDHSAIVQDYFGFSDDAFEKLMLTGSLIRVGTPYEKGDPEAPCPGSTLITGPFSIILGFEGGLMALNDRLKLRSMVVGEKDDLTFIASEEAAIRAMEPEAGNIWSPAGGEPVIVTVKEGCY